LFFAILGLRVLGGNRKSPLTGGAEAQLRHTGRGGGDAGSDGKRTGETVGRAGETAASWVRVRRARREIGASVWFLASWLQHAL